jgi:pimeloyl-ACP methyl ester carboxylesterase
MEPVKSEAEAKAKLDPWFARGATAVKVYTGAQGVQIAVQEWGNPEGQPILFAHPFALSHLSWLPQINSELANEFRLVTFDHRGHGESDKPQTPDAYNNGAVFADDLNAIITTLKLTRPTLVGWSMSGALLGDYLRKHGDANVGGVVLIGAATRLGNPLFQSQIGGAFAASEANGIYSESLVAQITGWNYINRFLTTEEVSPEAHDVILATSMITPIAMRTSILRRDEDYLPLYQKLNAPLLLVHAADDDIVLPRAAEQLKALRPDANYSLYETGAHAPHWEGAARFNHELAAFATSAFTPRP